VGGIYGLITVLGCKVRSYSREGSVFKLYMRVPRRRRTRKEKPSLSVHPTTPTSSEEGITKCHSQAPANFPHLCFLQEGSKRYNPVRCRKWHRRTPPADHCENNRDSGASDGEGSRRGRAGTWRVRGGAGMRPPSRRVPGGPRGDRRQRLRGARRGARQQGGLCGGSRESLRVQN
jgi:hypothetical protein